MCNQSILPERLENETKINLKQKHVADVKKSPTLIKCLEIKK